MERKKAISKRINKKSVKKNLDDVEFIPEETSSPTEYSFDNSFSKPKISKFKSWIAPAALILLIVGVILFKNGYIVSALVNGKPIFRFQLTNSLVRRFGTQALELMVTESLISDAARKANIKVNPEDITNRENEMVSRIGGGISLDDLLKYQGVTKEDFESQLKLQLSVEKILGKDINITDTEITNYIATSSATLMATDEATLKEEARQAIFQLKLGQKIQPWYNDLKTKAKIVKFF